MTAAPNRIELLNQLGNELAMSMGSRSGYPEIARHARRILDLSAVSLWVIDRTHSLLVKEAVDADASLGWTDEDLRIDEKLAYWQIGQRRRFVGRGRTSAAQPASGELPLPPEYPRCCISLPVQHKERELLGVLNLYSECGDQWYFEAQHESESAEFLRSVAGQVGLFIENRSLEANTTFYKEIHHRVKNNLQTVASILQMQIRRLGAISAEQALEDSINRILSIALVHETLSQGEIGLVNFGELLGRIARLLGAERPETPRITLEVPPTALMIASRETTALALVANELISNALHHGLADRPGSGVTVRLMRADDRIVLEVEDEGHGLPPGFDAARDGHLGLTIVATLVDEELRGRFRIDDRARVLDRADGPAGPSGTRVRVEFPQPGTGLRL